MSRQEDFQEQAKKYANECGGTTQEKCATMTNYFAGCEHGYQYAVNKACEFIRLHICVDIPVRLTPDGQPLAEDFFNKAEARANAAQNVVEQFKQFMEK